MPIQNGPAPTWVKTKLKIFIARELVAAGTKLQVSEQLAAELVAADKAERCEPAADDAEDDGPATADDLLAGRTARKRGHGDA